MRAISGDLTWSNRRCRHSRTGRNTTSSRIIRPSWDSARRHARFQTRRANNPHIHNHRSFIWNHRFTSQALEVCWHHRLALFDFSLREFVIAGGTAARTYFVFRGDEHDIFAERLALDVGDHVVVFMVAGCGLETTLSPLSQLTSASSQVRCQRMGGSKKRSGVERGTLKYSLGPS
jgi:hypothetical protein